MYRQVLQQRQSSCPDVAYPDLTDHPNMIVRKQNSKSSPRHANTGRRVSAPASPYSTRSNPDNLVEHGLAGASSTNLQHTPSTEPNLDSARKRRRVNNDAASGPPTFLPCNRRNDQMEILEYILSRMEQSLDEGCSDDSLESEDDAEDRANMRRYGGIVYIFEVQNVNVPARPVLKIGRTARPLWQRRQELERCLRRPIRIVHHSVYRKTLHFERLERVVHASSDARRHQFLCQKCQRIHSEYFCISPATASRTLDRWRKWLETEPYVSSGKLSTVWVARLHETRALLPKNDEDFDIEAVLDQLLQPFTYPQWLAQQLRFWFFTASGLRRSRFSKFQNLKGFVQRRTVAEYLLALVLFVNFSQIWPFYATASLILIGLCGAFLWWARIEYEIRLDGVLRKRNREKKSIGDLIHSLDIRT